MQYETIILEMLSRIKKLEEDVENLKKSQSECELNTTRTLDITNTPITSRRESSVTYKKMTDDMIEMCYRCGKKVSEGESAPELADDIVDETGMNRNSALMYLYAVSGMLKGEIYKRAISAKAMKFFFDRIFNDFGSKGLKNAIQSTKLHIDYRRDCGLAVESIEEICDSYERRL